MEIYYTLQIKCQIVELCVELKSTFTKYYYSYQLINYISSKSFFLKFFMIICVQNYEIKKISNIQDHSKNFVIIYKNIFNNLSTVFTELCWYY